MKRGVYDLQNRLIKFSSMIISAKFLDMENYASQHLIKQLIRSSTASALNYGEAQGAESKRDFIHKMRLILKELRESQINLLIVKEANLVRDFPTFNPIIRECNELVAIFASSLKTTQNR